MTKKYESLAMKSLMSAWLFSIALIFSCFAPSITHAQTIQLGSGTETTNGWPIQSNYGYNYSQVIYTAAEMTAQGANPTGGTITKILFKSPNSFATTEFKD